MDSIKKRLNWLRNNKTYFRGNDDTLPDNWDEVCDDIETIINGDDFNNPLYGAEPNIDLITAQQKFLTDVGIPENVT